MEISQYLYPIRRWWWLLVISGVLAAASSYYVSSQQPLIYQATATILIGSAFDNPNPTGNELSLGQQKKSVKYFIVTQNDKSGKVGLTSQFYHSNGEYAVIFMKSYGQFVITDIQTFHSMYIQMFILEKYDKDLFELVVSSPYSKIYRLKK